jgi:hypothetical protein
MCKSSKALPPTLARKQAPPLPRVGPFLWNHSGLVSINRTEKEVAVRTFGADDQPECPSCGGVMSLSRRSPHAEFGGKYERQTFTCRDCGQDIERSADTDGRAYD